MSMHLFGIVVTGHGTAANNRGDNEGNTTTLQKLLWNGDVHTTVSAEAIRWAIRYRWQDDGLPVNRHWNEDQRRHEWQDGQFTRGAQAFADDDVLGYMSARAAQQEAQESALPAAEGEGSDRPSTRRAARPRGTVDARRGRLEVTRSVSLTPWTGDVSFNAAGIGATPSASSTGRDPVPYSAEIHATRYQYGFALTPDSLAQPARALEAVDAIVNLGEVAGNHARFLFDFSPDSMIFRWTNDPAPRMLYGFTLEDSTLAAPLVVERVRAGDIDAAELIVGGSFAQTRDGQALRQAGASVFNGVKAAATEVKRRLRTAQLASGAS